jgi:hypothetical protein
MGRMMNRAVVDDAIEDVGRAAVEKVAALSLKEFGR